ncbi:MAG: FtsX-like permease family protein [Candidatus Electryonea clarkiae]|nr:FtsX-like permease family protein [Candidatus Electryonea clarkiae]MDP8289082.1 FtsX-like permease family protein [Candidatus Electryonea clarkiae]
MFKFLVKGLIRDRHRSLLPIIVVALGVLITVYTYTYMKGVFGESLEIAAIFDSGDVKITSRAYYAEKDEAPNDLALENTGDLLGQIRKDFPELAWSERIKFAGLVDAFDSDRVTRAQSGVRGVAIDLLGSDSSDRDRWQLETAVTEGRAPENPREILITQKLAERMKINVGEEVTLITNTINGAMSAVNLTVSGTVYFGVGFMDRDLILADLKDIRWILDMEGWTSELLGFFDLPAYDDEIATALADDFNLKHADSSDDPYGAVMNTMLDDSGMREYFNYAENAGSIVIIIMITAMGVVLWNAGLMSGIRRYGEMGLRLAVGESKGHVYRSLLGESIAVGLVGTFFGTLLGLGLAFYLQEVGIDISGMMGDAEIPFPTILRAKINGMAFVIGVFPGVMSTFFGAALSGLAIYKRNTAALFKELES